MPTSLVSAGRMNARASPVNTVTLSEHELYKNIEETLGGVLEETPVLCPGGIYKVGRDAGMPVMAGLYCIELRTKLAGKAENDRLKHLQEQFENISSAVKEVTETACMLARIHNKLTLGFHVDHQARAISEKEQGRATRVARGKANGSPAEKVFSPFCTFFRT